MKERVFRFKHFEVKHSASPMKVGVDGVLLGAWAKVPERGTVLDAGTGCGLIALMIAQRCRCDIVGIDIDSNAIEEASFNFKKSPWNNRLQALNADFSTIAGQWNSIVSNPPFFDSGKVEQSPRMMARHVGSLSPANILERAPHILSECGIISLIAPYDMLEILKRRAAKFGLSLSRLLCVSTVTGQSPKRVLCEFSRTFCEREVGYISIEKSPGCFTEEYISLTRDFYLRF